MFCRYFRVGSFSINYPSQSGSVTVDGAGLVRQEIRKRRAGCPKASGWLEGCGRCRRRVARGSCRAAGGRATGACSLRAGRPPLCRARRRETGCDGRGAQAPGTGSRHRHRHRHRHRRQAGVMVEDGREERGGVSDEGQKRKNRTSLAADPVFDVLVGVRGFEPPASTSRT